MMKKIFGWMLIVLLFGSARGDTNADQWKKFAAYRNQFYSIEAENFRTIECKVTSPQFDEVKANVKTIQEKFPDIKVTGAFDDFVVKYSKTDGFQAQYSRIKMTEGKKSKLNEQQKQGLTMVQDGYYQVLHGSQIMLSSIFDHFGQPEESKINLKKVVSPAQFEYIEAGMSVVEIYKDKTVTRKGESNGSNMTLVSKYQDNKKRLVVKHQDIEQQTSGVTVKMTVDFEYQELDNILFPKRLNAAISTTSKSVSQQGKVDLSLVDCKVKK